MKQARNISRVEKIIFYILILFLPTQLGKHFWPTFSQVLGIRIDYLSPTLYATDIFIFVLFLLWVKRYSSFFRSSNFKFQISNFKFSTLSSHFLSLRTIWLVFLIYLFINTLLSSNPLLSLYGFIKVLEMGFFGYYVSQAARSKKELSRVALITVICIMIESLLAIVQYSHQASINGFFYFLGERRFTGLTPGIANASVNGELLLRPYGTFSHPNVLAGYLLCMMAFVYSFLAVRRSMVKRGLKLFVLTLGSIVLLLTLSRVAIVLWFLMVIIELMRKLRKQQFRFFASILVVSIILFGALAIFGFLNKTPVVSRLLGTNFAEEAFIQRVDLIKSATVIIKSHPLLGVGLYNFIPSLSLVQKPISGVFYFQPVHNIYLLISSEIGIVGFLFFLVFIFKTYRHLIKSYSTSSKIFLTLLSIVLVLGLFDHYWLTLQQGQLLFAFVLGLCWTVNKTLS